MSRGSIAIFCLLVHPFLASAEVANVTIASRAIVAGGQSFGATGPYEKLVGRIEFALDPTDAHNIGIGLDPVSWTSSERWIAISPCGVLRGRRFRNSLGIKNSGRRSVTCT
jgi:hypothetical protein